MQPEQSAAQPEFTPAAEPVPVMSEATVLPEQQPIQWQAPEYLQEHRSPWWFIIFWIANDVLKQRLFVSTENVLSSRKKEKKFIVEYSSRRNRTRIKRKW